MKLVQALELVNRRKTPQGRTKTFFLACGFTPLHLQTFFHAHIQQRFPEDSIQVLTGLYGDLLGNVERVCAQPTDSVAVTLEWFDLDPRLGFRQLGGWLPEKLPDILACVRLSLERLGASLDRLASSRPVALSLPTLPPPPIDLPAGWQAGRFELELRQALDQFAVLASRNLGLRVLNPTRLDALSAVSRRFDAKSELSAGFPYHLEHAEILAGLLATLLHDVPRKKGLITDLDDTCWKGILGEVGVDGIRWDLAGHAQVHGIYQQLLHSLAKRGVLIAVASKNDSAFVERAFRRTDINLPADSVFPIEANWGPKSESVSRILKTWNIGADAVVFVDDSPMELAEVHTAHPDIECLLFPKNDPNAIFKLLEQLADLFGKPTLSEEDRIRNQSIRSAVVLREGVSGKSASYEEVLRGANARIYFRLGSKTNDSRAFELVNKTNQFNLNGKRYTESEWQSYFQKDGAFLLTAAYHDRFGPLGEIAVVLGRKLRDKALRIDTWVMSCRAFSRRIEHRCLAYLFEKFEVDDIVFDWIKTPRNGPLCEFLAGFAVLREETHLSWKQFEMACPSFFHTVEEDPVRG